jgi:hypothetical protein
MATQTVIALYGPRKALAYLASVILDDENVEEYVIHKDVDGDGYAYITATDDLAIDTYEAIENAPGVHYEIEEEAA